MKKTSKIKTNNFLHWYFNGGSDQEQESIATDLGYSIIEILLSGEKNVNTTAQEFLDQCNTDIIPLDIIEEFENTEGEIGEVFTDYEVELI
jgi:hypothetical protein